MYKKNLKTDCLLFILNFSMFYCRYIKCSFKLILTQINWQASIWFVFLFKLPCAGYKFICFVKHSGMKFTIRPINSKCRIKDETCSPQVELTVIWSGLFLYIFKLRDTLKLLEKSIFMYLKIKIFQIPTFWLLFNFTSQVKPGLIW